MSSDREVLRLRDIVDNIDRIAGYIGGSSFADFQNDDKTMDAVERCLQRITEAVLKIGPTRMAEISATTSVDAVRGMGNMLRHDYDAIDPQIVWNTITFSLPALREDCRAILGEA